MRRAVVAAASLLVLASCVSDVGPNARPVLPGGTAQKPSASPHGGPLYGIGDSLLVGVLKFGLAEALRSDGWEVETLAETGRSVRWAIDQVEQLERVAPYVVVVLGSNPGFSADGFAEEVKELRDALVERGARRIVWMPPHHPDPARYAEKVEILREADRTDGRLVVPDWGAELDAHPDWITEDGVHLREAGYLAMRDFIRDVFARLG